MIFARISPSWSRRQTVDELPDVGQDGLLITGEGPVIGAV